MLLDIGWSHIAFVTLRCVSSTPCLFKAFYNEEMLDFDRSLHIIEMTIEFLSLSSSLPPIIFNDLHVLNHPCISGMWPA